MNPRACHETILNYLPTDTPKRIAVIGAGPAGLAYCCVASERGHDVTLFEADSQLGGQFNLAKRVPGKEEFYETLRYYKRKLELGKVELRLGTAVTADMLLKESFDEIVVATGISPRTPEIPGINHQKVVSYIDVIKGNVEVGKQVAIIGAGGIGFDVAELIMHRGVSAALDKDVFAKEWGVDFKNHPRGGVTGVTPVVEKADRQVYLLQRKETPVGRGLGKTTGWTHRVSLTNRGVTMVNAIEYSHIDDQGLHVTRHGEPQTIDADTIIICAGQTSKRSLYDELNESTEAANSGVNISLIGGAYKAAELDAKAAINQASYLAAEV